MYQPSASRGFYGGSGVPLIPLRGPTHRASGGGGDRPAPVRYAAAGVIDAIGYGGAAHAVAPVAAGAFASAAVSAAPTESWRYSHHALLQHDSAAASSVQSTSRTSTTSLRRSRHNNSNGSLGGSVARASGSSGFFGPPSHPLAWDANLDQSSSRQFRPRSDEGRVFTTCLHPPATPPRRGGSAGTTLSGSTSASTTARSVGPSHASHVSLKRYHRPIKPSLPELNKATYIQYMTNTQPLLSACMHGRRRCAMSVWRDELLQRKIDPQNR